MTKNKLSRREFLRIGSAAAAGTVLAACGAQTPATQQPTAAQPADQPTAASAAQAPAGEGVAVQWWVGWGNLKAAVDKLKETPQFKEMIG
jgi:ABC-type glycerol-3-phosphate transport system substrate-binding protein